MRLRAACPRQVERQQPRRDRVLRHRRGGGVVPAGGVECSTAEPPPFFGRDEEELRACAETAAEQIDIS